MNKYLVFIFSIISIIIPSTKATLSGDANLYYISKLSDRSIINLPFRMLTLNYSKNNNKIEFKTSLALEYQMRENTDFLSDSNIQEFSFDIREFYITYIAKFGEFSIGKKIHSWGSVDDNSPLDNANSYDYFYLFNGGSDRKLGTYGLSFDGYTSFGSYGFLFSPLHNTNRLPLEDSAFPVKLPIYPYEHQILAFDSMPYEFGGYSNFNFPYFDIKIVGFSGFDRIFNLSAINVYCKNNNLEAPEVDIVYGYRRTNTVGGGLTSFIGNLGIRADIGFSSTEDLGSEESIYNRSYYEVREGILLYKDNYEICSKDGINLSYPLQEKSNYIQSNIQFEYTFNNNLSLMAQYFRYDILSYESNGLPIDESVNIPATGEINIDDLDPKNLFTPGMGAPISTLGNNLLLFNINKPFFNEILSLQLSGLLDLSRFSDSNNRGYLIDLETEYRFNEDLHFKLGISYIRGNSNHPDGDGYRFNQMEDFSHLRTEVKFFF